MNHAEFRGSHYEVGFQWGALLAEHGNFILHHVPFAVTKERIDFAAACVPIYQEYFPEILEEIQGLAVGLTSVYPHHIQPGINAGMLVRLFLEKCRTVRQVMELLERIPVSSAQTLTMADAAGEICVIECNADRLEIISPSKDFPFVCATNAFHSKAMAPYAFAGIDNWEAEPRYQTMNSFLRKQARRMGVSDAMELLKGNHGFLRQYGRATGKDTVWSIVYDIKGRKIYPPDLIRDWWISHSRSISMDSPQPFFTPIPFFHSLCRSGQSCHLKSYMPRHTVL